MRFCSKVRLSLRSGKATRHAVAYSCFHGMKRLGILLPHLPLEGKLVYVRVTPSIKFAGSHLCTCVEWGTVDVGVLPKNNTVTPSSCEIEPLQQSQDKNNKFTKGMIINRAGFHGNVTRG